MVWVDAPTHGSALDELERLGDVVGDVAVRLRGGDSTGMRNAGYGSPADVGLSVVTAEQRGRLVAWTLACPVDHRLLMESPCDLSLLFDRQNVEDELGG